MGEVYKARDTRLRREVAVKVLRGFADRNAWRRFQQEARAASSLSHPNICTVHDVGEAGGLTWSWSCWKARRSARTLGDEPLDTTAALKIVLQIAEPLEGSHAKGIILVTSSRPM